MTRSPKTTDSFTIPFTMKMRTEVYARLKSAAINMLAQHRSMSEIVHAALERYLPMIEERPQTFDEVYIRDRPAGYPPLPPSPATKAHTYCGRLQPTNRVLFHSAVLARYFRESRWDRAVWAAIARERRWCGERGEIVPLGFPVPEAASDDSDLAPEAQAERLSPDL